MSDSMAGGTTDSLFGPMLIGVFFSCILYGVVVIQAFVYFQTYEGDARWIKTLVLGLLVCETLNTVCNTGVVFEPLILQYGSPQALITRPTMLIPDAALTVVISTPVQLFIAWRIKVMSKSTLWAAIIAVFALTSFAGGIANSVLIALFNEYALFPRFLGATIGWLASSAAANIVITASLMYNLLRRRTVFATADDIIDRIIRLTVHTGLITAVASLLDLALLVGLSRTTTTTNCVFDFAMSKLYSTSLLSTLNARGGWITSSTIQENALFGRETGGASTTRTRTQIQVEVVTVHDHQVDTILDSGIGEHKIAE